MIVELPSVVLEVGEAVIVEVKAEAAPTPIVTEASSDIADEFSVPVMVAFPVAVEVSVAVYVPSLLFVTEDSVPTVVARAIVAGPDVRLFPAASLS